MQKLTKNGQDSDVDYDSFSDINSSYDGHYGYSCCKLQSATRATDTGYDVRPDTASG